MGTTFAFISAGGAPYPRAPTHAVRQVDRREATFYEKLIW